MTENSNEEITNKYYEWWKEEMGIVEKLKNRIKTLLSKNDDLLGKMLKYHLILESYLNLALEFNLGLNVRKANLKFFKKLELLQLNFGICKEYYKGIRSVNKIRNKFAHNLHAKITKEDMKNILSYTKSNRLLVTDTQENYVKHIESFTLFICMNISVELRGRGRGKDFLNAILDE